MTHNEIAALETATWSSAFEIAHPHAEPPGSFIAPPSRAVRERANPQAIPTMQPRVPLIAAGASLSPTQAKMRTTTIVESPASKLSPQGARWAMSRASTTALPPVAKIPAKAGERADVGTLKPSKGPLVPTIPASAGASEAHNVPRPKHKAPHSQLSASNGGGIGHLRSANQNPIAGPNF